MGSRSHDRTLLNGLTYSTVTRDIKISATPEFFEKNLCEDEGLQYRWIYHIEIENLSTESVQLLRRHWIIIDGKGQIQEVKGDGVVGVQPTIAPSDSFQYTSGSHLTTPSGIMMGKYEMLTEKGEIWQIDIPTFSLDSPDTIKRGH